MDEAKDEARRHAESAGLPLFEDGAEPAQYEATARSRTRSSTSFRSRRRRVVVPVGNGALLGGIGLRLASRARETLRIGVAAKDAPVMVESWRSGTVATSDRSATFADGLAVRVAIPLAVDVLGEVASGMLLVSERELAEAVGAFAAAGIRVEGAAAAALAALRQLDDVDGAVVLVTGRNIDDALHARATRGRSRFPTERRRGCAPGAGR